MEIQAHYFLVKEAMTAINWADLRMGNCGLEGNFGNENHIASHTHKWQFLPRPSPTLPPRPLPFLPSPPAFPLQPLQYILSLQYIQGFPNSLSPLNTSHLPWLYLECMFLISPIVFLKQHHEHLETTSECQEPTDSTREVPDSSTVL